MSLFGWKSGKDPASAMQDFDAFEDELERELHDAMQDIVQKVVSDSKANIRADPEQIETGRMLNSMAGETELTAMHIIRGLVGTNVEYAHHQEALYPFLAPAVEENRAWIKQRAQRAVAQAASEVS